MRPLLGGRAIQEDGRRPATSIRAVLRNVIFSKAQMDDFAGIGETCRPICGDELSYPHVMSTVNSGTLKPDSRLSINDNAACCSSNPGVDPRRQGSQKHPQPLRRGCAWRGYMVAPTHSHLSTKVSSAS